MDNKQVFDEQIKPLLDQILVVAKTNKIAFTAAFQTSSDESNSYNIQQCSNMHPDNTVKDVSPCMFVATLVHKLPCERSHMVFEMIASLLKV